MHLTIGGYQGNRELIGQRHIFAVVGGAGGLRHELQNALPANRIPVTRQETPGEFVGLPGIGERPLANRIDCGTPRANIDPS